jgi:hypothetical protein
MRKVLLRERQGVRKNTIAFRRFNVIKYKVACGNIPG